MAHLLVTNDFPPKIGGIQSYLWELWRRLPSDRCTVLTTPYAGSGSFDAQSPIRIIRTRQRVLLPTPALRRQIEATATDCGADLVVLDPALPVGLLGPALNRRGLPYALVVHGAEVTVPGRLPLSRPLLARVLRDADHVIAAGGYPLAEAERASRCALPATVIPPGVDIERFHPASARERVAIRERLLPGTSGRPLVVSASRLVPRKGMDVLIDAVAQLAIRPDAPILAISGGGRDRPRLERRTERAGAAADIRFLGRLGDDDLAALYRSADLYAMICRNRWLGLEQEGFGIVFLEAAASGVAQVAGRSGGSADAVVDGSTGLIVDDPTDAAAVARAIATMLDQPDRRSDMASAARQRAVTHFTYDGLARQLDERLLVLERTAREQRTRSPNRPEGPARHH